jgi:membrane protein implicated in regulation of membrane protease activity
MLVAAGIAGGLVFLLISHLLSWNDPRLLVALVAVAFLLELLTAIDMEANAPSRIDIGPGEKGLVGDTPHETAMVLSGFDSSNRGLVSIRGETWHAVRTPEDPGLLTEGTAVRVIRRKGLTLVVSAMTG